MFQVDTPKYSGCYLEAALISWDLETHWVLTVDTSPKSHRTKSSILVEAKIAAELVFTWTNIFEVVIRIVCRLMRWIPADDEIYIPAFM